MAVAENMLMENHTEKTIKAYIYSITSYIHFNQKKHPIECHNQDFESFLSFLANQRNMAPKTQSLVLNA